MKQKFITEIQERYNFGDEEIVLGKAKLNDEVLPEAKISIPLKTMNRHGLIAGATGTGKTKTLQIIAEELSKKGIPTMLMDIKGDISGLAQPGNAENKHIIKRHGLLEMEYIAESFPIELYSLSGSNGIKLRATVTEFGPILFSKILALNETQQSIISVLFKFCDDKKLPLIDLEDLKKVLQYFSMDGKNEIEKVYGRMSTSSIGAIMRKIIALEQQGAATFFGEPSFDVDDLLRLDSDGRGYINIIRVDDIQAKPHLFSTFMLSMLAEIYNTFPEEGDLDRPKLVIFIEEAHLIFKEATRELLMQLDSVIKLIRSKGVGIFFVTQVPGDVPENILSQLGLKVQHALRAFTAKDRKNIKLVSENYPLTDYYVVDELITQLGIGEAMITALNRKGIPTPVAHTYLRAPASRMDILSQKEIDTILRKSRLVDEYDKDYDRESAYEMLTEKMEDAVREQEALAKKEDFKPVTRRKRSSSKKSTFETIMKSPVARSIGVAIAGAITRSILGSLGLSTKKRTYRKR